jgi:plasmid stability protein
VTKTIQIRDVPDDIHRTLRTRAAAAGVSLSDYLLGELSRVAARPPVADVLARGSVRGQGVERDVVAEAVRAGRDRD